MKRFWVCLFLGFVIITLGVSLIQTPAYSQEPIARVSSFVGEVFVRSAVTPPAGEWRRLTAAPANLFNGDEVRTERGRAEVIYPNDDAVRILENSTARFTVSQEPRRRALLFRRVVNLRAVSTSAGKLWANVKVDSDNEMEFRSPVAVASVRGTILEFFYHPGVAMLFVGVATGQVRVAGERVSVDVPGNRGVTVARGQPPSAPFPYTPTPVPAISDAAMAAALDAPPAAPVAMPEVPVVPPPLVIVSPPVFPSFGGGRDGVLERRARTDFPAYGAFDSGSFPVGLRSDDNYVSIPFSGGFTFPFYGQTYTSAFVGTNGYITFNAGSADTWNISIKDLFRGNYASPVPTIATFENDPDPRGGTVNVTQFANSFVVTFSNVPDYHYTDPASALNTFRTSLFSNGQIVMQYNQTDLSGEGIPQIGISPGGPNARLNPVSFSTGSLTGFGPLDAIFQTFNNPAGADGVFPRSISHATLSVPGFPTTTIVGDYRWQSSFTGGNYLGTSPVTGNPFTLSFGDSFTLSYPTTSQSGPSTFNTETNVLSIGSPLTFNNIAAGEFQFAAGQNIQVAIVDRPILNLLNATLIFTPNAEGGYDVAFLPIAPLIPASPSS